MKIEYKLGERHIKIGNQEILLPAEIRGVVEHKGKVLVLLDSEWGMRNIFGYNEFGKQLWTIERPDFFKVEGSGFFAIDIGDFRGRKDAVVAICRDRPFYLDIETGKVEFIPGTFEK